MKRLLILLLILWVSCAQADSLVIEPYEGGIHYTFQAQEEFLIVECKTDTETVRRTVFSPDGEFAGEMPLVHTFDAATVNLTVETLKGYDLLLGKAQTLAVEQLVPVQNLADISRCWKLSDVVLTPMLGAMGYHFSAPGRKTLLLQYRSSTEKGSVVIYAGEDYVYDGVLELPYTYQNSNVVVTISDINKATDLYEEMLRTDYALPDPVEQGAGRLSGITVCIDPGHQAEGKYLTEEKGPGLSGTVKSSPGMARGTVTKRMESIVVLEIGCVLRDVLLAQGATVIMTRNTQDTYVSNIERAAIAAEADADFFLRLHGDNRDNENAQGIGIYAPVSSDFARAIADADGWREMCGILLAAMQNATGQTRGTMKLTNDFVGNNWAEMPNFLIEMGFMSNPTEDVLLSCEAYQQRLAQGMADGVYELAVLLGFIAE